jgi:hypothetical protein
MNTTIHHLDKSHQPVQLPRDCHDNQNHPGCVAVHEDSLYTPPTTHLAFCMGTTYNRLARPGEQGQMGRNHTANACRGNLPQVPWVAGYDPKLLNTIGSLQRHMAGEPYTSYQGTTPPLQAEEAGPPT